MRVFLDTNVLVSAVATRGLCADVLREILVSQQLVVSTTLFDEVRRVLHTKLGVPVEVISEFIEMLSQDAVCSEPFELDGIDIDDKDDVRMLSTAISGETDLFVTGDKELLELREIQGMEIVSPRGFWGKIKNLSL